MDVSTDRGIEKITMPGPTSSFHAGAIFAAFTTVFINSVLVERLSRFLVSFECYETYSLFVVSLASKLSVMLFINSAVIALYVNTAFTENIYGSGGLIYTEMYFFLSNAMASAIINFVDANSIKKKMELKLLKLRGVYTQEELNEQYSYPEHDIEWRYADLMKTLFITYFYAPILPAGYIISFFGIVMYYWTEKVRSALSICST